MSKRYYYWKCPHCDTEYRSEFAIIDHTCIGYDGIKYHELRGTVKTPNPSKWHRVEDELPDTARAVLARSDDYPYPITAFCDTGIQMWHSLPCQRTLDHVYEWRELKGK